MIYLSGGIEFADGYGGGWREESEKKLAVLGFRVYNPLDGELDCLEMVGGRRELFKLKSDDFEKFAGIMREIVSYDLGKVNECDYLLVRWDESSRKGAGTAGEVTYGFTLGKKIVVFVEGMELSEVSGWLLGCATEVCSSLTGALNYFKNISKGLKLRLNIPDVE